MFRKRHIFSALKDYTKLYNRLYKGFFYHIFILQLPYVFFEKFPDLEKSFKSINFDIAKNKIDSIDPRFENLKDIQIIIADNGDNNPDTIKEIKKNTNIVN